MTLKPSADSPRKQPFNFEFSSQHQAMPLADSSGLGDGSDLGQAHPANVNGSSGETLPPAVGEGDVMAFRHVLAVEAVFGSEEGILGDERLVLFDQNVGSNQTGEEGQAVHGAEKPAKLALASNGSSLHVIDKEKAILRPDAGETGLRIVQQMQRVCPRMSAFGSERSDRDCGVNIP